LNEINYEIFNLADMSDNPKKRLQSLSNIISNKPDIVIYGLDIHNFNVNVEKKSLYDQLLNPKNFFTYQFDDFMKSIQDKIPGSPKDRTVSTLKYILFGPEPHHHPLINFDKTSITPIKELQNFGNEIERQEYDFSVNNKQIISFKKIINEFKNNEIKLIIFSTPYQLTNASENDVKLFEKMLEVYSKKYDFPIYFLHDKYGEMEIWRDGIHIAINKDTQIYTKDVLKMLIQEAEF
jgi:RNase H-fold protein (predicted Holliday junction resolvase)